MRPLLVHAVHIRPAYAARGHLDQCLAGPGLRLLNLFKPNVSNAVHHHSIHLHHWFTSLYPISRRFYTKCAFTSCRKTDAKLHICSNMEFA